MCLVGALVLGRTSIASMLFLPTLIDVNVKQHFAISGPASLPSWSIGLVPTLLARMMAHRTLSSPTVQKVHGIWLHWNSVMGWVQMLQGRIARQQVSVRLIKRTPATSKASSATLIPTLFVLPYRNDMLVSGNSAKISGWLWPLLSP